MYDVTIAETKTEVKEAYELFYRSFGPTYYESKQTFDITRKYDSTLTPRNLFIIKNENGVVIATARSVTRNLTILDHQFTIGGIATTVVHPEYRGKGLFTHLTDFVLDEMKKRGLSMCLVFARRQIDNIYIRHGFWGTPVERKFTIMCPPDIKTCEYSFRKIRTTDIPFLTDTYRNIYGRLPVFIDRPAELWSAKFHNPAMKSRLDGYICFNKTDSVPIGYAIAEHGKEIIEVCTCSDEPDTYKTMLFCAHSPIRDAALAGFSLPLRHPALNEFRGEAYSLYTRHPHNGGNILRILDPFDKDSEIMQLVYDELLKKGVKEIRHVKKTEPFVYSRIMTAALFGYEIPETRKVLKIGEKSRWNNMKPIDFLFTSLDDF